MQLIITIDHKKLKDKKANNKAYKKQKNYIFIK